MNIRILAIIGIIAASQASAQMVTLHLGGHISTVFSGTEAAPFGYGRFSCDLTVNYSVPIDLYTAEYGFYQSGLNYDLKFDDYVVPYTTGTLVVHNDGAYGDGYQFDSLGPLLYAGVRLWTNDTAVLNSSLLPFVRSFPLGDAYERSVYIRQFNPDGSFRWLGEGLIDEYQVTTAVPEPNMSLAAIPLLIAMILARIRPKRLARLSELTG
jgi:hypothetical protein